MNSREILDILKNSANLNLEYKDGRWCGYGTINNCPECNNMSESCYHYKHYPAKKEKLESLPWTNVVKNPRYPQDGEYPTENGHYITMLDCDEHAVFVNEFKDGQWSLYNKTHVKWWMPVSMVQDQFN